MPQKNCSRNTAKIYTWVHRMLLCACTHTHTVAKPASLASASFASFTYMRKILPVSSLSHKSLSAHYSTLSHNWSFRVAFALSNGQIGHFPRWFVVETLKRSFPCVFSLIYIYIYIYTLSKSQTSRYFPAYAHIYIYIYIYTLKRSYKYKHRSNTPNPHEKPHTLINTETTHTYINTETTHQIHTTLYIYIYIKTQKQHTKSTRETTHTYINTETTHQIHTTLYTRNHQQKTHMHHFFLSKANHMQRKFGGSFGGCSEEV